MGRFSKLHFVALAIALPLTMFLIEVFRTQPHEGHETLSGIACAFAGIFLGASGTVVVLWLRERERLELQRQEIESWGDEDEADDEDQAPPGGDPSARPNPTAP